MCWSHLDSLVNNEIYDSFFFTIRQLLSLSDNEGKLLIYLILILSMQHCLSHWMHLQTKLLYIFLMFVVDAETIMFRLHDIILFLFTFSNIMLSALQIFRLQKDYIAW